MAANGTTLSPAAQELAPKNFSHLLGMEGFSERMLSIHFQLYEGYVKNSNSLLKKWEEFRSKGEFTDPAFAELKRRFGWVYNSVKLHEAYFGVLGKVESDSKNSSFERVVSQQFGSFEKWRDEFLAVASMRGIGWAVLYRDPTNQKLINCWIDEHNNGHLIQSEPILVLDVFEHAFLIDYGIDRKKYLTAFMKNVQWDKVELRLTGGQ
jgi:Fe-Mn family superoxide dismutase